MAGVKLQRPRRRANRSSPRAPARGTTTRRPRCRSRVGTHRSRVSGDPNLVGARLPVPHPHASACRPGAPGHRRRGQARSGSEAGSARHADRRLGKHPEQLRRQGFARLPVLEGDDLARHRIRLAQPEVDLLTPDACGVIALEAKPGDVGLAIVVAVDLYARSESPDAGVAPGREGGAPIACIDRSGLCGPAGWASGSRRGHAVALTAHRDCGPRLPRLRGRSGSPGSRTGGRSGP